MAAIPASNGSSSSSSGLRLQKVSFWVKAFVVFHVVAITIWCIPEPPKQYQTKPDSWKFDTKSVADAARSLNYGLRILNTEYGRSSIASLYLLPTGFWQYWDMFAPDPASTDIYCDAIVTYRDGSKKIYHYPRMYDLSIPVKYAKERYRKYYERAHSDDYEYLWPQFALRIAHLMDNPTNPPVEVNLRRHWEQIAPPGKPQPTHYNQFTYYRYAVDQSRLRSMRGGAFASN